jgi:hypothetical protein
MKRIKLSTNFTVFVLFFGVATLETFQTRNWLKAIFWLAIGIVFLVAEILASACGKVRNGERPRVEFLRN